VTDHVDGIAMRSEQGLQRLQAVAGRFGLNVVVLPVDPIDALEGLVVRCGQDIVLRALDVHLQEVAADYVVRVEELGERDRGYLPGHVFIELLGVGVGRERAAHLLHPRRVDLQGAALSCDGRRNRRDVLEALGILRIPLEVDGEWLVADDAIRLGRDPRREHADVAAQVDDAAKTTCRQRCEPVFVAQEDAVEHVKVLPPAAEIERRLVAHLHDELALDVPVLAEQDNLGGVLDEPAEGKVVGQVRELHDGRI
jgi:hypothetical protein